MIPKVSVIIPVYNVEKYLKRCLDSIINQTLRDIEIICIDDGSTDKSLNILKEYCGRDHRIKILTQQNQYAGVARNNGLKIAQGKYLSFLDSDDFFKLNMLEEMYNKAEKDNSDIVICYFYEYNMRTNKAKNKINNNLIKSPFIPKNNSNNLFEISNAAAWTKLFKRDLFIDNNLHFEDLKCCNDITCVYTALALAKKISIVDKSFVYYRINQNKNLTSNRYKDLDSFLIAIQHLEDNLKHFNVYNIFKTTFISRAKKAFDYESKYCTNEQKEKRKILAKEILSNNLYTTFYGNEIKVTKKQVKKQNKYF